MGSGAAGLPAAQSTPIQVLNLSGIDAIACGSAHGMALRNDGTVWVWGSNSAGQLGNGGPSPVPVHTPFQVPSLTGVTAIDGGQDYSLALRNDGTVWAWGRNNFGQLGIDSLTDKAVPAQVVNLTGVTSVTAGPVSGLARKSDGSLWGWGLNDTAQLGNPVLQNSAIPVLISR
jgi:alpha-tubulin suppressor-like RCC1 family protein